nr:MAG TPA: hypothetical protein [Caudoviricetes sp.]
MLQISGYRRIPPHIHPSAFSALLQRKTRHSNGMAG